MSCADKIVDIALVVDIPTTAAGAVRLALLKGLALIKRHNVADRGLRRICVVVNQSDVGALSLDLTHDMAAAADAINGVVRAVNPPHSRGYIAEGIAKARALLEASTAASPAVCVVVVSDGEWDVVHSTNPVTAASSMITAHPTWKLYAIDIDEAAGDNAVMEGIGAAGAGYAFANTAAGIALAVTDMIDPCTAPSLVGQQRYASSCLHERMQGEVLTLAWCFKISWAQPFNVPFSGYNEDGLAFQSMTQFLQSDVTVRSFGFTTHDHEITLRGVAYEPFAAVQASNVRGESGGQPDSLDALGVLTSDCITESDMLAGRYDNAELQIDLVDWSDLSLGSMTLFKGYIGDVVVNESTYKANVRSLRQRYQQQVGELTSPTCRAQQLGDHRCKVNVYDDVSAGPLTTVQGHDIASLVTVAAVDSQLELHFASAVNVAGFYTYGTLTCFDPASQNYGLTRDIKLHSDGDGIDNPTIVSTPSTVTGLAFKTAIDYASSQNFTFAIPAGQWDSATIRLSLSALHRAVQPFYYPDQVNVQAPPGQANDYPFITIDAEGLYDQSAELGYTAVQAINTAAGGTFTIALRHTAPNDDQVRFYNVDVTGLTLELFGQQNGTSTRIVLHEPFPFDASVGELFYIVAGCNRLPLTCSGKFNNIVNFRGEPHIPGTDVLLRTGRQ